MSRTNITLRARSAQFAVSAAEPHQFPAPTHLEIAFAGRSNVGKSSLINALVGVSRLARTSNTPGRTRLINWFDVVPPKGPPCLFVDLPGYGYAKVSRSMRDNWRPLIEAYLGERPTLRALVLLIDARRGAEDEERGLLEWLVVTEVPAIVVVTKIDKLPKNKRKPVGTALARDLALTAPPLLCSAETGDGLDDLWRRLAAALSGRTPAGHSAAGA